MLEKGQVEIIIDDVVKKQLKPGDQFGELALLYNQPRSASVRAVGNCGFWAIDRNTFRKAVEELVAKEYDENRQFMESVTFFKSMTQE